MADGDLCGRTAVELAELVRSGNLSARELLAAHLERIEAVNPGLNAIVTLVPERAMDWAAEADERQARGEPLGPIGVKLSDEFSHGGRVDWKRGVALCIKAPEGGHA